MSQFKKGDYVFVKHGTSIDGFGKAEGWGGKVTEVDGSGELICIQLNAPTLKLLPDDYLAEALEHGEDVFEYNFLHTDLVLGERCDTDAEYHTMVVAIQNRLSELDDDFENEEEMLGRLEIWAENFSTSDLAKKLSPKDQEDAHFVANTFVSYAWNYVYEMPMTWDAGTVKQVCLHYIVGKVSMAPEEFENYGKILALFFQYLYEEGHIPDSTELQKTALEIAPEIVKRAADPTNWHMAKSMMMGGLEQGLDMSDPNQLNNYLRSSQLSALDSLTHSHEVQEPIRNTKKIGRNDKVTVKYQDGKVVKDIKYKKVMRDVERGKCSLM